MDANQHIIELQQGELQNAEEYLYKLQISLALDIIIKYKSSTFLCKSIFLKQVLYEIDVECCKKINKWILSQMTVSNKEKSDLFYRNLDRESLIDEEILNIIKKYVRNDKRTDILKSFQNLNDKMTLLGEIRPMTQFIVNNNCVNKCLNKYVLP